MLPQAETNGRGRILRRAEVQQRTGLPTSSLYRLIGEGKFPRPVALGGGRARGWHEADVDEFLAEAEHGPTMDWSPEVRAAIGALAKHSTELELVAAPVAHAQTALDVARRDIDAGTAAQDGIDSLKQKRGEMVAARYSGSKTHADLEALDAQIADAEAAAAPARELAADAHAAIPRLERTLADAARVQRDTAVRRDALLYAFGEAVCLQLAAEVAEKCHKFYLVYEELFAGMRTLNSYVGDGRGGLMGMPSPTPVWIGLVNRSDPRWPTGTIALAETPERRAAAIKRLGDRLDGLIPETTRPEGDHANHS